MGLSNYAKNPATQILMCAWALDHEEISLWQPHVEKMPQKLRSALLDSTILKIAWKSDFERTITKNKTDLDIPLEQWRDPIVLAHNLSLPGKLEHVAIILKMQEKKDERGKALIKMFSEPVNRKKIGEKTLFGITDPLFRDWNTHPKEWAEFCAYCIQDVRAERDLWYRLLKIPFPEIEWQGWLLDQKINEFGMPCARDLATKALAIAVRYVEEQNEELKHLTGIKNPNSNPQMKGWLSTRGYPWNS